MNCFVRIDDSPDSEEIEQAEQGMREVKDVLQMGKIYPRPLREREEFVNERERIYKFR